MITCPEKCIEWIKIGISGLTLVSIFIAFLTYRANLGKINDDRARERDKEYVSQFKSSLEWSFNALTADGKRIPPKADRLNWLTAARHILRAKKIQALITHPTYITIAEEIEEFWRHKYYLALSDPSLLNFHYFMNKDRPAWPENIEITSALVVIDFSNWKNGTSDPTDLVDHEVLMTQGEGLNGNAGRGLRTYIQHLENLKKLETPANGTAV
ncbi:hypothetical protein [Stenotrophomonas sp. MMGLT7]|uniref:hypothetical protein n=1 Tax=Stenotrophomonas sp. MMGLT7 TaxID=2901227 RepID=UPI001E45596E|nr:hypothetical protein [Stenotrophomonas sp. MMGLT7]MCD7097847.1 hypothetical protein [Stenotrophomonas sp. MMGLT7]